MSSTISKYAGLIVAAAGTFGLAGCSDYNPYSISDNVARTATNIMKQLDKDGDGYLTDDQIRGLKPKEPCSAFTYEGEAAALIVKSAEQGRNIYEAIGVYRQDSRLRPASPYIAIGDCEPGGVR